MYMRMRSHLGILLVHENGSLLVDGVSDDIKDPTEGQGTDRDLDGGAGVLDGLAADHALSGLHGNGADGVLSQVGGDFEDDPGGWGFGGMGG